MINGLLWSLMGVSGLLAATTVAALVRRGLIKKFPFLAILLAVAAARSACLLAVLLGSGKAAYNSAWLTWQPLSVGLHLAVCTEAFIRVCRHFRGIRWFGTLIAGIFSAAALGAVYASTVAWNDGYKQPVSWLVRALRCESLGCLVFLALTVAFFSQFDFVPMRKNVVRHVVILATFFACLFASHLLIEMFTAEYWWVLFAQIITLAGTAVCYLGWAGLTVEGEQLSPATSSH